MIEIAKYNRPKNEGGSSGGGNTFINNSTTTSQQQLKLETHSIFGQPFNGTSDVSGDISNVRNFTSIGGDINVKATSDEVDKVGGNIYADGTVTASKFVGDIDAKKADILNAIIKNLSGEQLNYLVGVIKDLSGSKLNYNEGVIKKLLASDISVDTLTVTKAAHFFSLILDEIKSVGGQIILSPSNSTLDLVKPLENAFKCYWKATDGDKTIYNQFAKDDQVVCQTFNLGQSNTNVSNTYYWRKCTEVGTETIDGVLYNYIILSDTDKDLASISIPTVGDKIVQLGNKSDATRQNAIILSAYNSKFLDKELVAPSIVQYSGINDYQLESHRKNVISTTINEFVGNFKISTGETIEDYIKNNIPKIKDGKDGNDAEFYILKPLTEIASVDKDCKFGISLKYNIQHIVGSTITNINAGDYYVRFRTNINSTNTKLSVGNDSPSYQNLNYQTNYYNQSDKVAYLIVELVNNNVIYDSRIVTVILQPAATFEIKQKTDTELASIKSWVFDNETKTENGLTTLINKYSAIEQKANGIENRVGKIESSKQNIINDKQFFINSDNQPHQSREYNVTTDTYTFRSTDKTNDIDYGSEYVKLDAGKYLLAFTPTLNGEDIRMKLMIQLLAKPIWNSAQITYDVIKYSDIPQHKLYTYEFTVTEEKPYLNLYLESAAQQNQKTLPWIVKLQNTKLLKISESESLIKQTSDNIILDADTVQVNNNGKLAALFRDGKIKADYIEANNGVFQINNNGFYYQGKANYNNGIITTKIYNDGFHTKTDETIKKSNIYSSVDVTAKSDKYNIDIVSNSQGAINIQSLIADLSSAISITDGNVYGLRKSTEIVTSGIKYLDTFVSNIVVTGDNKSTLKGNNWVSLVLPDNYNLNNGRLVANDSDSRLKYIKDYKSFPQTLQIGQEYTIYKRNNANLTITVDADSQSWHQIAQFNDKHFDVVNNISVVIPPNWFGVIKVLFDGYYWNLIQV